jgi:hypothetical protein
MITGILGYFDSEEVYGDRHLMVISTKLENKLYPFRNGTQDFRNRTIKAMKKKKKNARDIEYIEKANKKNDVYLAHIDIADRAWKSTIHKIKKREIDTTNLIVWLLKKDENAKRYFGFSDDFLRSFKAQSANVNHTFSSIQVANRLLESLSEQIAHYYYNNRKDNQDENRT